MSFETEMAAIRPYARRFARAITGSQYKGNAVVDAVISDALSDPRSLRDASTTRIGLYKSLVEYIERTNETEIQAGPSSSNTKSSIARLPRTALILNTIEDFDPSEIAEILELTEGAVSDAIEYAMRQMDTITPARVLIIEDEPLIAMQLDEIVRKLGHTVLGPARTSKDAVEIARQDPPNLVLSDIQLGDGSSGLDATREILSFRDAAVIFVTAYPERLLTGDRPEPTYLVTKPYQEKTITSAIQQALFFSSPYDDYSSSEFVKELTEPLSNDISTEPLDETVSRLAKMDVAPKPGPLDVEISDGRLVLLRHGPPETASNLEGIEALRGHHCATAERLHASYVGTNLGAQFEVRLKSIRDALSSPFDEFSGLLLGVQAHGLRRILPAVREQTTELSTSDLEVFLDDMLALAWQFSGYRIFVAEARILEPIAQEARQTIAAASRAIESLPDELFEPRARDALTATRESFEASEDELNDLSLVRAVGNVFRASARFLVRRLTGIGDNAAETFDKVVGGSVGAGFAILALAPMVVSLSTFLPQEFAFLVELAKLAKLVIP